MERSAESPIGNMPIEAPTGPVIPELSDQPCSNFGMADHGRAARVRSKEPAPRGVDNYPAAYNGTSDLNSNDYNVPTKTADLQLHQSAQQTLQALSPPLVNDDALEGSAESIDKYLDPVLTFKTGISNLVFQQMLDLGSDSDEDIFVKSLDGSELMLSDDDGDESRCDKLFSQEGAACGNVLSDVQLKPRERTFPVKEHRSTRRKGSE
jgi:hypothetical protein